MNSQIIGTLIYALVILILLLSVGYLLMLLHRFLDHIFKIRSQESQIRTSNEQLYSVEPLHDSGPPTYDEVIQIIQICPHAYPTPKWIKD